MARTTFKVEVLTPEGEVFNDEVEMIATKTVEGSIGILAKHQPLLAMLDPAELRLYRSESEIVTLAQGEGYLQVAEDGGVLILVEEAHEPAQLDTADLSEKLRAAEEAYARADAHSEEQRLAARDKRRWEAFQRIASGS
ncbi:ATP synthase F1 subunit epsilon [Conexibacter sp. JD483]|uniref:ATP synthase F1 subunit epsilon n=1 Tax=unclassified Conexibacter TaxID=2627773 RepID=UPI00271E0DE6|nr:MULTISPECIES: ATP synthase F1 subunit epsilon [unclassified Conexibacter]MDO8186767.1 ATP synthase F1 subunit epsilon [Conexibacter sp. CPCC 205706]MDO8199053.1 ATP synthase F1 subunit epsilon [Conexibacter sp. CPCC 205762]MDR9368505.1 ATP synthase F1 subunit epsilon [Conexibacter sp. JD483]